MEANVKHREILLNFNLLWMKHVGNMFKKATQALIIPRILCRINITIVRPMVTWLDKTQYSMTVLLEP